MENSTAAGTARRARTSKVIDAEEEVERERSGLLERVEERARGGIERVSRRIMVVWSSEQELIVMA